MAIDRCAIPFHPVPCGSGRCDGRS
jgi:hypothetical protein